MDVIKLITVWALIFGVATALQKCCPQPENEHKCNCCPDACCCVCENSTGTVIPPTNTPPGTTELCVIGSLDVALIADSSFSIGFTNWGRFMDFLSDLVAEPAWGPVGGDEGTRFGFIKFNTSGHLVWSLLDDESETLQSLQDGFANEPYLNGFTNTVEGLDLATDMLTNADRDDALYADVAIHIADGLTNEPENYTTLLPIAAQNLRDNSDLLFVVAIGSLLLDDIGLAELQMISGRNDNASIFFVDNFASLQDQLPDMIAAIVKRICETVTFPTPTPIIPTTIPIETCKCCCPPLPRPKKKRSCGCYGGYDGMDDMMDDDWGW